MITNNIVTRNTPIAIATLLILLLSVGCGARRSEQYRLEGDTYFRIQKYEEAITAYKKSEEADPKNPMAKVGLGRCYAAQKITDQALQAFRAAIALSPELEIAYVEAIRLQMNNKNEAEALKIAQQFETIKEERGAMLRAYVLRRSGQLDEAIALLETLKDRFDQSVDTRVTLAAAYIAAGTPEKAEEELQFVLQQLDPTSLEARMALIEAFRLQERTTEIVTQLEELVAAKPEDNNLKLSLARGMLYTGQTESAEKIAQELLTLDPKSGWANYIIGSAHIEREKFNEAIPFLQSAVDALPQETIINQKLLLARSGGTALPATTTRPAATTRKSLAAIDDSDWRSLWQQGAIARLVRGREQFLATGDEGLPETLLLAALFVHNFNVALSMEQHLQSDSPLIGYLAVLQKNDIKGIIAFFDNWQEEDTDRSVLRENAYGYAFATAGANARAIQVFSVSAKAWPENGVALFNIAQLFRGTQIPQFAASTLQRLISIYPNNLDAHTLLFVTLREAGLKLEMRAIAETTYALFKNRPEAVVNLSQAYVDNGELDRAEKILERTRQTMPDNIDFQFAHANILLRQGKYDDAWKILTLLDGDSSNLARATNIKLFCAALKNDWTQVENIAQQRSNETWALPQRLLLVAAHLQAGQTDTAAKLLTSPQNDQPIGGLFGTILVTALGKTAPELNQTNSDLANQLSKNTQVLSTFAFAAACQQALLHDAALQKFQQVYDFTTGHPRIAELMVVSLAKAHNVSDPIAQARNLATSHPNYPELWLSVAAIARAGSDLTAEAQAFEQAYQQGAESPIILLRRAQFLERGGKNNEAVVAYREADKLNLDDATINNNLAYLLLITDGDTNEALARAKKAIELLPTNASIRHTLGLAQLRAGDLEESQKSLSIALEQRPGDPTLLLDYGQLLMDIDQQDEGRRHIELSIQYAEQLDLDFPRSDDAKEILDQL